MIREGAQWRVITEVVPLHTATDMIPIYSEKDTGFIHMLKTIDPRYVLPSRNYFAKISQLSL